ncbi:MAG: aldo/keto reductase [Thermodesulfobacteriota bacterium]
MLGKTGLTVTKLGFGGIPIQRVNEREAVEVVAHAIERGVDFIDTSRAYTTSERRIGKALQKTGKKVVIASKSHGRTYDTILRDLETSLRELNLDYIDLYQAHFVRDEKMYAQIISPGGAIQGLRKAREDGLIGHIGITSHNLDLVDKVLDDELFDTIMVCFSLLEPKAQEAVIPKAREKNVGLIAMKAFSGGIIDNASLALKYVLSQPGIAVLVGVEQKGLFDENWEIFRGSWDLDDSEWEQIEAIRSRYEKNFCRRCDYCQPCSEGIPIQQILGIRSMVKRMGTRILMEGYMAKAIDKARNCTECGECMTRCPYNLPIPDLIKENLAWVDERRNEM